MHLKQLHPERNAKILKLLETLSYGQVAERLGITRNTVAGVVNRENKRKEKNE